MPTTTTITLYPEQQPAGYPRLGRHQERDERSAAFMVDRMAVRIRPAEHPAVIPILDQDGHGSCTGEADTYAISYLYRDDLSAASLTIDGQMLTLSREGSANQDWAMGAYHLATVYDGLPGLFPPDDSGSTGIGICRGMKREKLIASYNWARSLHGFATLLQRGPVLLGMPWLRAFFNPDKDGFIDADPNWFSSPIDGGHEVDIEALETWDDENPERSVIRFPQSWGLGWGGAGPMASSGYGRMRLGTYFRLLQGCDVKQMVRATA